MVISYKMVHNQKDNNHVMFVPQLTHVIHQSWEHVVIATMEHAMESCLRINVLSQQQNGIQTPKTAISAAQNNKYLAPVVNAMTTAQIN